MQERFHILSGPACNNNCIFCMEHHGAQRSRRYASITPARVLRELREHAAGGEVMFTSGEPSLNRNLPTYVRWARQLGYRQIGLTTNARRLSYEPYARELLDAGLNLVVVSVHGPDARCHDGQTRTPGSFRQTLGGLETLGRLKSEYQLVIHTSTVVGQRNYRRFLETYHLFQPRSVDQVVFNVMQPLGRAARNLARLVARYSDIITEFAGFLAAVGQPRPPVFLVDLPPCTTEGLPDEVRGYVELSFFSQYSREGRRSRRESRVVKEEKNRAKRDECGRCAYDDQCLGVWRNYVAVYGWDEFKPVAGGRRVRAPQWPANAG